MTRGDFARIVTLLCAPWLVLLLACGESHMQSSGTNTNWLRSCTDAADCDPDAECLCGVCTRSCSEASECDDIGATCAELHADGCGAAASGSACLLECGDDDDCDRSDRQCSHGACTPISSAQSGSPGDAATGSASDAAAGSAVDDFGESNQLPADCELSFAFLDPPVAGAGGQGGDGGGGQGGGLAPERVCGCTRRPSPRESFRCPQGTGQSVTQEVGPEGATVQLTGTPSTDAAGVAVELKIPFGALDRTVTIRITETSVPPPEAIADWSPLYHLEPEDLTFDSPVELKMPYAGLGGYIPRDLTVYASETPGSCALAPLPDFYNNAGFGQGTLRNFGWLIVGVSSESATCDGVP